MQRRTAANEMAATRARRQPEEQFQVNDLVVIGGHSGGYASAGSGAVPA